jgi:hypothetical protein
MKEKEAGGKMRGGRRYGRRIKRESVKRN